MKKSLVTVMAMLSIGGVAFASSEITLPIPAADVRLEIRTQPINHAAQMNSQTLVVESTGVVAREELTATGEVISRVEVTQLTPARMYELNNLIDDARSGAVETDVHQFHCMAMGTTEEVYTADNGKVFLLRSAICQDPTENKSPEAAQLVGALNDLNRMQAAPVVSVRCQSYPAMADAGYNVGISYDKNGNALAEVAEESFVGANWLGTVSVGVVPSLPNQRLYNSLAGQKKFSLAIDLTKPLANKSYWSSFSLVTDDGRTAQGALSCRLANGIN